MSTSTVPQQQLQESATTPILPQHHQSNPSLSASTPSPLYPPKAWTSVGVQAREEQRAVDRAKISPAHQLRDARFSVYFKLERLQRMAQNLAAVPDEEWEAAGLTRPESDFGWGDAQTVMVRMEMDKASRERRSRLKREKKLRGQVGTVPIPYDPMHRELVVRGRMVKESTSSRQESVCTQDGN